LDKKRLKILLVEDSEDDSELIARKLRKEGYRFDLKRVETEKAMKAALDDEDWDLIICNYILPRFDGKKALKLARGAKEDIPFMMVSGKIGEEKAVEILKGGASDFVMKDNLARLPFAVDRALEDARLHREKQKTAAELRKVGSRYHMLAENISDVIWTMDTRNRFTFVSPSVFKITGYSIKEILTKGLDELFVPGHRTIVDDAIERILASFKTKDAELPDRDLFEAELVRKEGSVIYTETEISLLLDDRKKLHGFFGVTRDISQRKLNEKMLRESESRLRLIMDHTPDAVLTTDLEGKITFINKAFFGKKVEDIVGTCFCERIVHPDPTQMKGIFQRVKTDAESINVEIKDKNSRWWHARMIPVKRADEVDQILFISRDITEIKKTEQERFSLAAAVEQLEEGIIITDTERKIRFVNDTFENNSGFKGDEIIGKPITVLCEAEDNEDLRKRNRSIFGRKKSWKGRISRCRKDGGTYEAEIHISPLREKQGAITSYIIIERDITEELEMEEQFRRMQKMEALGTLAGGIAHDFNNILMPIIINTELLLWETSKDDPSRQQLEQTLEAAYRGKDLVKQILTYSRKSDVVKKDLDMVQTVKEILRFLGASMPSHIEIQESSTVGTYLVNADPVQIQQVLMNIFKNAADAIGPSKGRITIQLSQKDISPDEQRRYPNLEPGPYLMISISDTGSGIEKKAADRIFDPFFSTKKPGEGTGMGLAVVQRIIKNHQGDIGFSSVKGKGTVFRIYLPRAVSASLKKEPLDESIPRGNEHILLVEDEREVILSMKRLLESLGYEVTGMTKAKEALKMLHERDTNFDLIITDVVMPEMSGLDLAQELKKTGLDIPVILTTGFAGSIDTEKAKNVGIKELMMKPISPSGLAQAIRRVLDGVF
jgi:PAS domain S-box-containing protein